MTKLSTIILSTIQQKQLKSANDFSANIHYRRKHSKDRNDVGTFTQGIWFTCLRWVSCEHTPDTPPHQAKNNTGIKLKSTDSGITPLTYRTSSKLTLSFDQGLQHTPCHDRPRNREVSRHKSKDTTLTLHLGAHKSTSHRHAGRRYAN